MEGRTPLFNGGCFILVFERVSVFKVYLQIFVQQGANSQTSWQDALTPCQSCDRLAFLYACFLCVFSSSDHTLHTTTLRSKHCFKAREQETRAKGVSLSLSLSFLTELYSSNSSGETAEALPSRTATGHDLFTFPILLKQVFTHRGKRTGPISTKRCQQRRRISVDVKTSQEPSVVLMVGWLAWCSNATDKTSTSINIGVMLSPSVNHFLILFTL